MAARIIEGIEGIRGLAGREVGSSEWFEVAQDRIDRFADATMDHQWIHTDPKRAADSRFGGTIAHGYLTLSLLPYLLGQVVEVRDVRMALNYGLDRLRFPAPLPVGRRVRLEVEAGEVEDVPGGVQIELFCAMQVEGGRKPVMVAKVLYRYYG